MKADTAHIRHYEMLVMECCICLAASFVALWGSARLFPGTNALIVSSSHLVSLLALIATVAWLGTSSRHVASMRMHMPFALACLLPLFLVLSVLVPSAGPFLCMTGYLAMGAALGACMMLLATFLGSCAFRNGDLLFSICILIALLVALALTMASALILAIVALALTIAGFLLYRLVANTIPQGLAIPPGQNVSVVKIKTSIALSCQSACATTVIAISCLAFPLMLPIVICAAAVGIIVGAFAQRLAKGGHINPASMQRATAAIIICSMIIAAGIAHVFSPQLGLFIAVPCAGCALAMLMVFNWNVLVTEVREFALDSFPHFRKGFIGIWTGIAIGFALSVVDSALTRYLPVDASIIHISIFCVTTLLLAASPVFCKPDDSEDFETLYQLFLPSGNTPIANESSQSIERRCAIIAKRHMLTNREAEVLEYLARGRNARHVQEELCVSFSTAKTHIYHIYQKLNINSQQQLIDLVEDAVEAKTVSDV